MKKHGTTAVTPSRQVAGVAAITKLKPTHTIVQTEHGIHLKPLHETANSPMGNAAALATDS